MKKLKQLEDETAISMKTRSRIAGVTHKRWNPANDRASRK